MIPRGLKQGDTFLDGPLLYKILSVNGDGSYISTRIEAVEEAEKAELEPLAEAAENEPDKAELEPLAEAAENEPDKAELEPIEKKP